MRAHIRPYILGICLLTSFSSYTDIVITTPIAVGELIDKITILEIKQSRITQAEKLYNVTVELEMLQNIRTQSLIPSDDLEQLTTQLYQVNEKLWDIEDALRDKERLRLFDDEFIQLARAVYYTNDKRCRIKRAINELYRSHIIEEKSYQAY